MTPLKKLRPLTLLAALLASTTLTTPASAQEHTIPDISRTTLREARGEYVLEDGRMLTVHVGVNRMSVGLDDKPLEAWRVDSAGMLVSPDGLRRLRLYRNGDGSVDRVTLEIDRPR